MNKYEKIIYWSDEDDCFVIDVPELPGCMAHGDTEFDALNNINDAIELWLEVAKNENLEIPTPKGRRLVFYLILFYSK